MATCAPVCPPEDLLEWESWKRDTPFWIHAIAGSCAGVVEHSFIYPFDTIKTRLQAIPFSASLKMNRLVLFPELFGKSNIINLFRGLPAISVGCIPAHAVLFSVYEVSKSRVGTDTWLKSSFCGGVATLFHDIILTPSDVVKQRLQLGCYKNTLDCYRTIYKQEGFTAFYRSFGTTLFMNIPSGAILVAVNEMARALCWPYLLPYFSSSNDDARSEDPYKIVPLYFLTAGIAGAVAGASTTPLDVIKTRLQTQGVTSVHHLFSPTSNGATKPFGHHSETPSRHVFQPFGSRRFSFTPFSWCPSWLLTPCVSKSSSGRCLTGTTATKWTSHLTLRLRSQTPLAPPQHRACAQQQPSVLTPHPLYTVRLSKNRVSKSELLPLSTNTNVMNVCLYVVSACQSFFTTAKTIFREEGWRGLWKGTFVRVVLSAPSAAICWGTYETVKWQICRRYVTELYPTE